MVTNLSKNNVSVSMYDKTNRLGFLLMENGSYLLQENYGKIILSDSLISVGGSTKHAGTVSNLSKS